MKAIHLLPLYLAAISPIAHGATVVLVSEGTIDQSSIGAFPLIEVGDAFRLSVSYSVGSDDTDADPDLGVYLPSDLRIIFEVIGKGIAFESLGGSVNVLGRAEDFPVYSFISKTQPDGRSLFLLFNDQDRSNSPLLGDGIPVEFGSISDYDAVVFSIIHTPAFDQPIALPIPGTLPKNLLDGTITKLSIPEPSTPSILAITITLLIARRNRTIKEVEQVGAGDAEEAV
jgi:hypothetical protein